MTKQKAMSILATADTSDPIISESSVFEAITALLAKKDKQSRTTAYLFVRDRMKNLANTRHAITTDAENLLLKEAFNAEGTDDTLIAECDKYATAVIVEQLSFVVRNMSEKFGAQNYHDFEDWKQEANMVIWEKRKEYNGQYTYMAYIERYLKGLFMNLQGASNMGIYMSDHDIKQLSHVNKAISSLNEDGITDPTDQQVADRIKEIGWKKKTSVKKVAEIRRKTIKFANFDTLSEDQRKLHQKEYQPEDMYMKKALGEIMQAKVERYDKPYQQLYSLRLEYQDENGKEMPKEELYKTFISLPGNKNYKREYVRKLDRELTRMLRRDMQEERPKRLVKMTSTAVIFDTTEDEAQDYLDIFLTDDDF